MSKIIGSCGHSLTGLESHRGVFWKGEDREGSRAVICGVICDDCYYAYKDIDLLLFTQEEQNAWLSGCDDEEGFRV